MTKRRRAPNRPKPGPDFWGNGSDQPDGREPIRPTPDPAALPRSLGDPPLGTNAAASQHHLAAVYQEAVRAATALVAANGLLAGDDAGVSS
jgi:hypothetical protein